MKRIINKTDSSLVSGMCQGIIDDANDILSQIPDDCCLPTWWTSKLAVASAYLNSLRDYVTYSIDDLLEEAEENETPEDEAAESPEEQAQEMLAGIEDTEEDDDEDDMTDIADEMLPPSARMMKNASKAR